MLTDGAPDEIAPIPALEPVWRYTGKMMIWRCIQHDKRACVECTRIVRNPSRRAEIGAVYPDASTRTTYEGTMGARQPLSKVGDQTGGVLACPRCGSSQFTAKRSNTGKAVGFATLGVGGVIAPKSQVKCVACGLKFKRG